LSIITRSIEPILLPSVPKTAVPSTLVASDQIGCLSFVDRHCPPPIWHLDCRQRHTCGCCLLSVNVNLVERRRGTPKLIFQFLAPSAIVLSTRPRHGFSILLMWLVHGWRSP
jgi:hypothetical protein